MRSLSESQAGPQTATHCATIARSNKCKILVDEEYVKAGGDDNSCGALVYVSFSSTTSEDDVQSASATLLNLPVLTTGLWGDGSSATQSVLSLASENCSCASLVVVPQANLISKVKQRGQSIQYHGQISKERGREFYELFCDCIRGKLLEAQCLESGRDLPKWYRERQSLVEKQSKQSSSPMPSTPTDQIFRDETKYSAWDERGVPTKDAEGQELSKSSTKKLNKIYVAHAKKHEKWINSKTEGHGIDESQDQALPPAQWEDLDHSFCHFIAGSFGKRQGLEFKSDMGPFVHSFAV